MSGWPCNITLSILLIDFTESKVTIKEALFEEEKCEKV